jgi:type III secretion protein J
MVASSIPGMTTAVDNSQKLTVIFVPAAAYQEQQRLSYFGPFLIPENDLAFWRNSIALSLAGLVLAIIAAVLWRKRLQQTALARARPPND